MGWLFVCVDGIADSSMSDWPNNWPSARATLDANLFASPKSDEADYRPTSSAASSVNFNKGIDDPATRQMESDMIRQRMMNLQLGRFLAEDDRRRAKPNPTEDELVSLEDLPPPPPQPPAAPSEKPKPAQKLKPTRVKFKGSPQTAARKSFKPGQKVRIAVTSPSKAQGLTAQMVGEFNRDGVVFVEKLDKNKVVVQSGNRQIDIHYRYVFPA
jgi:hypothetical protein